MAEAELTKQSRRLTESHSAITVAFLESSTFLKKFLAGLLRAPQDIEDVAQEAYLRAYTAERREQIEQPTAFLFRVAKNLALTRLARRSQQIAGYMEDACTSIDMRAAAGSDEELEAQQCLGLYCEAIASLSEKGRQVFLLRKVHGLTHQQIGEHTNLSVSSVEKYLRQGILACRIYLQQREQPSVSKAGREGNNRGQVRS